MRSFSERAVWVQALLEEAVLWVTLWRNFIIFSCPSIHYGAFEEIKIKETLSLNFSFQPSLPLVFPVQVSGLQVCAEGSFNSWAVPSDRASFILNARVSRLHGSCHEIKQGKKKILIRVPSPGSWARINHARHEIIETITYPKECYKLAFKKHNIIENKYFTFHVLNKPSENLHQWTCMSETWWLKSGKYINNIRKLQNRRNYKQHCYCFSLK